MRWKKRVFPLNFAMKKEKKYELLGGGKVRLNLGEWDIKDFNKYQTMMDKRLEKEERREARKYEKETAKDW